MDILSIVNQSSMSKADIARAMDCSNSYVTQLVSGKPEPTLRKLQQLADIIKCKRWEFFKDEITQEDVMLHFSDIINAEVERRLSAMTPKSADSQPSGEANTNTETQTADVEQPAETPSATTQGIIGMLACPHCHHAIPLGVVSQ